MIFEYVEKNKINALTMSFILFPFILFKHVLFTTNASAKLKITLLMME